MKFSAVYLLVFSYLTTLHCTILAATPPRLKLDQYEIDIRPLHFDAKKASEYVKLQKKSERTPLTAKEHNLRLDIVGEALNQKPDWLDGYWMLATDAFFLGTQLGFDKQYTEAEKVLEKGIKATTSCLDRDKDNFLCGFFHAALLAKYASIKGIFSSLGYGKTVRDQWLKVVEQDKNMSFRSNVSLQGSAYYGLGLFFRLVPDFFLVEWLWGIRGNLDQSIAYHKKAAEFDRTNPCANLMLAVALMCKSQGEKNKKEYKEALTYFAKAEKLSAIDISQEICQKDAQILRDQPNKNCGYTQAKYHNPAKEEDLLKKTAK